MSQFLQRHCSQYATPVTDIVYADCQEWLNAGYTTSGVYPVYADGGEIFQVYCDMSTDGGGWTIFQRRMDGSVDFYRDWEDYEKGFGKLDGEFWLGLSKIHRLTKAGATNSLRVELADFKFNAAYAKFSTFNVDDGTSAYKLTVSGYTGTAGNSLTYHNGQKFTTKDKDNDSHNYNCAIYAHGGWWFNGCSHSNLNGIYQANGSGEKYITWYNWKTKRESLSFSEMKIRKN